MILDPASSGGYLDFSSPARKWQDFLADAGACAPSVVVLDQVESVCRRRPEAAGITELQVCVYGKMLTANLFKFRLALVASATLRLRLYMCVCARVVWHRYVR